MRRLLTAALLLTASVSAMGETILLQNGDVINAPVTAKDTKGVTINHPSLGEVKIERVKIKEIYKTKADYDEAMAKIEAKTKAKKLAEERAADEGIFFGSGFLAGWNRRLEAGVNGSSGNSENFNTRIAFFGDYEDKEDRWLLAMVYNRANSNGAISENKFYSELTKDWLIPEEDYFYFANGRYDWDDLQDWEHRLSAFGGVGYQFYKDEDWDFRGRAGLGGTQEFGSVDDGFTLEALLGVEVDYKISENSKIAFTNTLYPSLEEAGDFRNITTLDYVITINKDKGIDLKIGIANEHDSNVAAGTRKNDFDYYAALVWRF